MVFFYPREISGWLFNTLWMGFRFDALIASFILILSLALPWGRFVFAGLWCFLSALYFINSLGWAHRGEHLWRQDLQNPGALWSSDFMGHKLISFLLAGIVINCGLKIFNFCVEEFKKTKVGIKSIIYLILFVFARGSLGEDHLRRNHCDGRPTKSIKSFCMNPAYTFMKLRNGEFL
ncbi:MAG: hypothetical protein ACK5V3_07610 [Bdellovibrionales bacterium]